MLAGDGHSPPTLQHIQCSGGQTEKVVNQQQPSGGWARLGTFSFVPGQNHRVEVAGALEGETVADAIRFVSVGTSAPGILYVHADHLGTPQKMTDANQTLVWDAVYTPFGQVHSIAGTATNNQRFPGQFFDQDTGYHYNYFRDYDPTTGRYVQSDPIGLAGGLNRYVNVRNNPIRWPDPLGLTPPSVTPPGVDICKNIEAAKNMSFREWIEAVQTNGPWDFKQQNRLFEAYGNYHYGVAGRANGWSPGTLERAAGFYQQWSGTGNDPAWGAPWDWMPPYGDDPMDQHWID